uniref:TauD/TfdA-like domain-containing protein n=1 Tax=Kwoniella bestiolae CBS 10118 TaxID=1296100 RepID=A0A1B9GCC5_9TREE|nr:hypothetical protein I302_00130 [Kwoniella bestiolae CBS 10118]OCF28641.1 hypothetical protein I302_00130 [Kwoniella bestiolae CBS 10118]
MPWIAEQIEPDQSLYPHLLPVEHDGTDITKYDSFTQSDPALRADTAFTSLLNGPTTSRPVTPLFGTELSGLQLSQLDSKALDELGLLVAERGFVVLRNQDWKDTAPERQIEIASRFGPLHEHHKAPRIRGYKQFAVIYQSAADVRRRNYWGDRASLISWHTDQSHEKHPPGITFFWVLENQDWVGGDTILSDTVQAFAKLSQPMKEFLYGLDAWHTDNLKTVTSRKEVDTLHPVVTRHPVTDAESLFVNETFTRQIQGLKTEESEYLLKFLFDHIARGGDFQARIRWEGKSEDRIFAQVNRQILIL